LIFLHESVGYGDSYIFHTVEEFHRTGMLYPSIGPGNPTPTLYSPMLYLMHLAAWSATPTSDNRYLGPRLVELLWYFACIYAAAVLTHRLVRVKSAFWLGILLAASYSVVIFWVLQLRSDFPAIACSLLALIFLTKQGRRSPFYAGICAGLALQFKIVFVAAAVSGCIWLCIHKRWRDLVKFAAAAAVVSVGLYAAFAKHEPEMLTQILMMRKSVRHPPGVVVFLRQLIAEPGFVLAVAGMLPMASLLLTGRRRHVQLVMIFVIISLAAGTVGSLQAGASINYFYEALFAATPFAVLALLRLQTPRSGTAGLVVGLLLLTTHLLPGVAMTFRQLRSTASDIKSRNREYEELRVVLGGTRILSSIPDITALRPDPAIVDPYLLSYLSMTQGADLSLMITRLNLKYYDVVVTQPADYSWRGIPQLVPSLRTAIVGNYIPYCLLRDSLFHMPDGSPSLPLEAKLRSIGCEVTQCGPGSRCPGLAISIEAFR